MIASPAPVLRPLNVADIIDLAIRLYRRNFGPFLGIIAIVYAPLGVMTSVAMYLLMGGIDPTSDKLPDMPTEQMAYSGGIMALVGILYVLTVPLCEAALAVAVSRRYLGEEISVRDAYGVVLDRFWTLVGAVFLAALVVMAALLPLLSAAIFGTVMLVQAAQQAGTAYLVIAIPVSALMILVAVIPGVWVGTKFLFVGPIVALERQGAVESMQRSWQLVTGHWWRVFGTALLLTLLVSVATYTVAMPLSLGAMALIAVGQMGLGQALSQGMQGAVGMLLQPIWVSCMVLLYYDLRVRKEAFDLQLLAEAMQKAPKAAPDAAATLLPGQVAPPAALPPEEARPISAEPPPYTQPPADAPAPLIGGYGQDESVIIPLDEEMDNDEPDSKSDPTY